MRVTERMFKDMSLAGVIAAEKESIDVQNRISSGKDIVRPSDDPLKFVTAHRFKSIVKSREQELRNISDARRFVDDNEAAVGRVTNLLQQVRLQLVRSGNETFSTADLRLTAHELRGHLDALIQFANAGGVGGKIFAGSKTDADPFEAVRDANDNVTDVIYRGNTVTSRRGIAEGSALDVNYVGSKLFQVDPDTAASSFSAQFAGQALDDAALTAGDTTGYFSVQGRNVYFDNSQDSLLDLADRINQVAPEATARVAGTLTGTTTVASASAALAGNAGIVNVNGVDVTFAANASLDAVVTALNAVTSQTGVTASAAAVAGGFALQLDGGVELNDTANSPSNVFQVLGATSSASPPTNLTSRNALAYRLEIATADSDQLILKDSGSGRELERLGFTDGSSNSPANEGTGAVTDNSLFSVLITAIDDLENGRHSELRGGRLSELDRGLERILKIGGDIGGAVARLNTAESKAQDFIVQAKSIISSNEDLDFAVAISDLRKAQLKLETAIGAAQSVPTQNLLKFL